MPQFVTTIPEDTTLADLGADTTPGTRTVAPGWPFIRRVGAYFGTDGTGSEALYYVRGDAQHAYERGGAEAIGGGWEAVARRAILGYRSAKAERLQSIASAWNELLNLANTEIASTMKEG